VLWGRDPEREVENLLSVMRESAGLKFYCRGHNARCAPSTRVSLFLVLETRVLVAHLTFHCKGRHAGSSASCIDPKARRAPNGRISFLLASSSTV
jgi:hypothetical protein